MKKIKANYSLQEVFRLGFSYVMTKIFWKDAKIIRYPHQIRGIKAIEYGSGFSTGYEMLVDICFTDKKRLKIGDNCDFGNNNHITATEYVQIGDNFLSGSNVFITDTSHGKYRDGGDNPKLAPKERKLSTQKVIVGNNVWVGENVSILPGVMIGDGCIIGANSVVTKSVPAGCIAVGNPLKIIKKWDDEEKIWKKNSK